MNKGKSLEGIQGSQPPRSSQRSRRGRDLYRMEPGHQAGGDSMKWVFRIAWQIVAIVCGEEVTSMQKKLLSKCPEAGKC